MAEPLLPMPPEGPAGSDGGAKEKVHSLDEVEEGSDEVLVVGGDVARRRPAVRPKAAARRAPAKAGVPMRPAPRPRLVQPKRLTFNPFAKPVQITVEDDETRIAKIKARVEKARASRSRSRSRSRRRRKGKKRRRRSSSSSPSDDIEKRVAQGRMLAMAQNARINAGVMDNGLVTGGYGMGPPPAADLAGGNVKTQVCIKFLQDDCPLGNDCPQKHPLDRADCQRWICFFNRQMCKNGDQCKVEKCIYDHPNRAGWCGKVDSVINTAFAL